MPRILIVEDDMEFRTLLETMVRLEGHEVHLAANGETGFSQAKNKQPDIILSDIEMPGMSGIDLIESVRSTPETQNVYLILITGATGQEYKLDALRAGADDFLEKPASRQEILGRIEIAQKVMAVQQQLRDAEAQVVSLQEGPKRTTAELDALEKALDVAREAVSKRDPQALMAGLTGAGEALGRARAACKPEESSSGESWL